MACTPGTTSDAAQLGLDPRVGETGKLFDLDIPACPSQFAFSIQRTAETYVIFYQWASVDFGYGPVRCSSRKTWSYTAQIDGDAGTVIRNELSLSHIPPEDMVSHFTPR